MAETKGLVQRINVASNSVTCAWIGPTPTNVEALTVNNDGTVLGSAFATSLIQVLTAASANYREVVAEHNDKDAKIKTLRIEPI